MIIDDLVRKPSSWLSIGADTGIVISSRVRLARNISGHKFPFWAEKSDRVLVCNKLHDALNKIPVLDDPLYFDMGKLDPVDRDVLRERHLISSELAEMNEGSGLIVAGDEKVAVMINEEDHLRLQAISPGMNLEEVLDRIDSVDTELEKHFSYAFSRELGYLTACPSNVGTGLRASVMMHLSGLRLMGEIDQVVKGLNKMGFAVRGLLGEGSEASGNMFQVSNQSTLGQAEREIVQELIKVVGEVALQEKNARLRLLESRKTFVVDQISRAFAILTHAQILSSREAIDLLSGLRLGVDFEMVDNLNVSEVNEIMLLTQPGHLQKMAGKILSPAERDEVRSNIVRQKLEEVALNV